MRFFWSKSKRGENATKQAKQKLIDRIDILLWLLTIICVASQDWKVAVMIVAGFSANGMLEWFLNLNDESYWTK